MLPEVALPVAVVAADINDHQRERLVRVVGLAGVGGYCDGKQRRLRCAYQNEVKVKVSGLSMNFLFPSVHVFATNVGTLNKHSHLRCVRDQVV